MYCNASSSRSWHVCKISQFSTTCTTKRRSSVDHSWRITQKQFHLSPDHKPSLHFACKIADVIFFFSQEKSQNRLSKWYLWCHCAACRGVLTKLLLPEGDGFSLPVASNLTNSFQTTMDQDNESSNVVNRRNFRMRKYFVNSIHKPSFL